MNIVLAALALHLVAAQPNTDPCPATSSAWIEVSSIPDSLLVPPQWFFDQSTVPLEALIVCEHGVFFNFHAMQDKASKEYYVSFPVPTREEYRQYVPVDTLMSMKATLDKGYIDRYVDRQVTEYTKRYNALKNDLRRRLGNRYIEGARIDLTKDPVQIRLGFPFKLLWSKESLKFETYPGIYWRKE